MRSVYLLQRYNILITVRVTSKAAYVIISSYLQKLVDSNDIIGVRFNVCQYNAIGTLPYGIVIAVVYLAVVRKTMSRHIGGTPLKPCSRTNRCSIVVYPVLL